MYSCLVHLISQPSVRSGLSFGGEGGVGKSFKNCKHRERHIYFLCMYTVQVCRSDIGSFPGYLYKL